MPLEQAKIDWLLMELGKTEHPTSYPHGRPIALRYSLKDIQKGLPADLTRRVADAYRRGLFTSKF